jgi:hypothetical protein
MEVAASNATDSRLCRYALISAASGLLLLALARSGDAQRPIVRDSAGITIVENPRVARVRPAFTLSARPTLEIAGRADDLDYQFSPNIVAVGRLSDGRVVIADQWSFIVRTYSPAGKHLRTFGGKGKNPGELQVITRMFILPGDTIAIVDGRVSLFSGEGELIRVESMGASGLTPLDHFSSGAWLARRDTGTDSVRIMRVARSSFGASPSDTGVRLAVFDPRLGSAGARQPKRTLAPTPFLPSLVIEGMPDGFLMGDGRTYEIAEYSAAGQLRRIIRRDIDLTLTEADRELYSEGEIATRTGEARKAAVVRLQATVFPKTIPAYQRILHDPSGRIWVQDHIRAPHIPLQWTVFDRQGKMLGTVQVPVGFRVFEVGKDYVLGRLRDASGDAYIQLYRLTPARR